MAAVTTTQRSPAVSPPVAHRQRASRRLGPPIYRKVAIGSFTRAREVSYSNAGIGFDGATGSSTRPDRTIRRLDDIVHQHESGHQWGALPSDLA